MQFRGEGDSSLKARSRVAAIRAGLWCVCVCVRVRACV